ncbi:glycosyltransferase family 39 protein [Candidatus Woesearchaeota archaeon]|nr:glycosyltransferase family 39 protein [Candidatus Woesearchaeota archaeon]
MLRRYRGIALVVLAFVLAAVVVNPIGDFALDDDFAYGRTVLNFSQGNFRVHEWLSATVVFQAFVGVLFVKLFGFSFTVLRFASILMALAGVAAAYLILRELDFSDSLAAFGSAVLAFNPLYFSKAFNFHSDIYFLSLMLVSLLFFVKAVKMNNHVGLLFVGSVFCVFSILVRQNGLLIPPALVAYLWINRRARPFTALHFLVVAILPLAAFAAYGYWFYFMHGATESAGLMSQYDAAHLADLFARLIPYRFFAFFVYIGVLLLPLTVPVLAEFFTRFSRIQKVDRVIFAALSGIGALCIFFMYRYYGKVLFYLPTIIHSTGLGPAYLQGAKQPEFAFPVLLALSFLAVLSAAAFALLARRKVAIMAKSFFGARVSEAQYLVYFISAGQLAFLLVLLAVFDRYLLPLFFPAIVLTLRERPRLRVWGVAVLVLIGIFSVAGTQDYLEWNRAKNAAIAELSSSGVPPDRIDGGFEHAAWNFYEYSRQHPEVDNSRPYDPGWIRDYFPVIDSQYVISFSPVDGYEVVNRRPYFSLLAGRQYIYTLKRA